MHLDADGVGVVTDASVLMLMDDIVLDDPRPRPRPNELASAGAGIARGRESGLVFLLPSNPRTHDSVGIFCMRNFLIH